MKYLCLIYTDPSGWERLSPAEREAGMAAYMAYGEGLKNVTGSSSDVWKDSWKKDQWNRIRARIKGATPHIEVWLNDQKITDWTDSANHAAGGATSGKIALQVHSGGRWQAGGVHRFRAIAVRELR